MILRPAGHPSCSAPRGRREQAFSLAEVLVTLCISGVICAGVVASQLYGMRMSQLTQAKVNTRDRAGQILRLLSADVQSARSLKIGQGSFTSFTEAGANMPQQGNALQIHPTTDPGTFIRYYRDNGDAGLKRMTNGAASAFGVAHAVSNNTVFTAEGFAGNILTNRQSRFVVGVDLQFFQLENPELPVGPGNYYTAYQLRSKIAPRNL